MFQLSSDHSRHYMEIIAAQSEMFKDNDKVTPIS